MRRQPRAVAIYNIERESRQHTLLQLCILYFFFALCCDTCKRCIYGALNEYQTTSILFCHTQSKYTKIMPSANAVPRTLYDKVFQDHIVDEKDDSTILLYIDRHLVHEVTSPQAFEGLRNANRRVRRPDCTLATTDHVRKYGSRDLNCMLTISTECSNHVTETFQKRRNIH